MSWTPELRARTNARIAEGQARAWRNPEIRERRTTAIAAAWDDALRRALMHERVLKRLATVKQENR